jgi:hypothetical protein
MAIGTDDLALLDLGEDVLPGPFTHALADAELFFSQVVELQDERIALPAIHAWMLAKERDEIGGALGDDSLRAATGGIDVALLVARVVLVLVGGSTGAAIVVALPTSSSPPGEFVQRFLLLAPPA